MTVPNRRSNWPIFFRAEEACGEWIDAELGLAKKTVAVRGVIQRTGSSRFFANPDTPQNEISH